MQPREDLFMCAAVQRRLDPLQLGAITRRLRCPPTVPAGALGTRLRGACAWQWTCWVIDKGSQRHCGRQPPDCPYSQSP